MQERENKILVSAHLKVASNLEKNDRHEEKERGGGGKEGERGGERQKKQSTGGFPT